MMNEIFTEIASLKQVLYTFVFGTLKNYESIDKAAKLVSMR